MKCPQCGATGEELESHYASDTSYDGEPWDEDWLECSVCGEGFSEEEGRLAALEDAE